MRILGGFLWAVGALTLLGVDVLASVWLLNEHGLGWVVAAWVFFVPLFFLPFFAGYGWIAAGAMVVGLVGVSLSGRE